MNLAIHRSTTPRLDFGHIPHFQTGCHHASIIFHTISGLFERERKNSKLNVRSGRQVRRLIFILSILHLTMKWVAFWLSNSVKFMHCLAQGGNRETSKAQTPAWPGCAGV
ncbi:hypothetical protein ACFSUK_15075 [Sphingobium scionense]|uniref:Uncharacterized protein n=1 Tax=Sphingobium scionense TaxID=1404341 RepID=A0A7W6PXN2_9SPHN|nr:hypothetical protein [Sphingobium scionense]MBB4149427.1 hypothetical protein [Sphingobium scionense]